MYIGFSVLKANLDFTQLGKPHQVHTKRLNVYLLLFRFLELDQTNLTVDVGGCFQAHYPTFFNCSEVQRKGPASFNTPSLD